ncbi:hypothetical protein [Tolumonas lignilytica]|jgi:hypothetical protein|uniref:hypothetical protein n=1 Tax=Tolumonas lignilytica TaxID=1283284 RepID=UPI000463C990|nr:hypothetical protein [Tolumonas lignilytica]
MVSKKQDDISEPQDDLESKDLWLRKFRMAKTPQTLTLMVERAIDQYHQKPSVLGAIYLAECQRERELESGILLNR